MTDRQMLRLVHAIVVAGRRAKKLGCPQLTRALDTAGYYAGLKLGESLAASRAPSVDGENADRAAKRENST